MLNTDDFVIVVPHVGDPVLVEAGDDLSTYTDESFFRINKVVALKNGRLVTGSVFRGRPDTASDELQIMDLLNHQFAS